MPSFMKFILNAGGPVICNQKGKYYKQLTVVNNINNSYFISARRRMRVK